MRHPFDGLVEPQKSRRSWLGGALAAVAGLFFGSRAFAAAPTTAKVIVEPEPNPEPKPRATQAKAEEGKLTKALNENGAVTKALNENGRLTKALNENGMTLALNENGRVTTLALGEEGGNKK